MANKSKKGRSFERFICCLLSSWWTNGERDDVFWHSSGSGARATVRSKLGKSTTNSHGDVSALDDIGKPLLQMFCIELKRGYNRFTIHDLLDKPNKAKKQKWEEWIDKAQKSADLAGSKSWMIINKRDRKEALVVIPYNIGFMLMQNSFYCLLHIKDNHLFIMPLDCFLKEVQPENIIKIIEEEKTK